MIDAFTHPVSEFVNVGLDTGFAVREMGEWRADGNEQPQLLSIRFGAVPIAADSSRGAAWEASSTKEDRRRDTLVLIAVRGALL
jgi:hypothetical protein